MRLIYGPNMVSAKEYQLVVQFSGGRVREGEGEGEEITVLEVSL